MSRLKKKHPKLKKFPVGWGVFGDPNFNSAKGGGQVSRLKKKTRKVEKVPGRVGCFWGQLLGLKTCMAHS